MHTRQPDARPHVIGWHDSHSAAAALIDPDGRILYAAAEERYTKRKMQKGFPAAALTDIHNRFGRLQPTHCYTDLPLASKTRRHAGLLWNSVRRRRNCDKSVKSLARTYLDRARRGRFGGIVGESAATHDAPPINALCEHHTAHAACAYFLSGFDRAYVVTIDGVGDCLSATVSEGARGTLKRRRAFYYNDLTVGADYETLTALLGFNPDRHCGKITGLAAYGKANHACIRALGDFWRQSWRRGAENYFDRMHGPNAEDTLVQLRALRRSRFGCFSREDLAYAMQHLAEQAVLHCIRENVPGIAGQNIALAGGVFANVRINQKIKALGFANIFIAPPMDDGGLSIGAAYDALARTVGVQPHRVPHMFLGAGYTDDEIQDVLDRAGVRYERTGHPAGAVARLLAEGKVVGRFDGRMEFGPRALGNRSILYHTRDPAVNTWLNHRLNRTEFMPFAPATLVDEADRCYEGLDGCRHTAEFMTITFDCTDYMKRVSPAVVHVDGTARAQLVTAESNPGLYEIVDEYRKITGIPSIVNTSFNMHEAPIIASPEDAIATFHDGRLDYLAMGPFLVKAGRRPRMRQSPRNIERREVART